MATIQGRDSKFDSLLRSVLVEAIFNELTAMFLSRQVDGIVSSVNKMGFFAEVGPLTVFVSSHVSLAALFCCVPSH